eukprot:5779584-Amphidinium_carterae.1
MVAELALTRERESTSCTMDERETTFEFKEEREIDNGYMTGDEYIEMEEHKETEEYSEYNQTM